MRILHANKYLHRKGGAEAHMLDVADLQRGAGHEVALFGMRSATTDDLRYGHLLPSDVELDPDATSGVGEKLRIAGRMIWSVESGRAMGRVLDDFRPDLVHLHNIYHQLSPSIIAAAAKRDIPTVMTVHDYKLVCPSYQLLAGGEICEDCIGGSFANAVRRRCQDGSRAQSGLLALESGLHRGLKSYRHVARFLCPSQFLADKLVASDVYPDRVRVLNNFIPVEPARPDDGDRDRFVFIGRLSHEKGVDVLIRALGSLPEAATLTIAGDGPLRSEFEQLAAQVAPGRVTFAGHVSKPEVLALLAHARAVVVPSRWHENQPLSVLEAMEAGAPVVTTTLGGLPELVQHGENGWAVPADDPAALAAALAEVLADPREAHRRAAGARSMVERNHAPDVYLRRLDALYAEALTA